MIFHTLMWQNLRESAGTPVVISAGMSDVCERVCVALVLLGVILIMILFGHAWLPLSASDGMPAHEKSRPALPDWPVHHTIEYRA
jgi:hypothetical protein